MKERIGVYICHCGGNISDYVEVEKLREIMKEESGVVISKDVMFACADSNQKEMIKDIEEQHLDAIVVASCSPKLHLHTFRNVAKRAGLNQYNYVQVNIREQCSWPHSDQPKDATLKAVGLVRAGIKRVSHSEALENIEIQSTRSVVIIGAGVSGLRAASDLARMGNEVYLIEKEERPGGEVARWNELFIAGQSGKELTGNLLAGIKKLPSLKLFTRATVERITGSLGNFSVIVRLINQEKQEKLTLRAGCILVTTGFDHYHPVINEYGFQTHPDIITLPDFKTLIENSEGKLIRNGKEIKKVAYIYCVGSRQENGDNKYCSRVCCTSAVHSSLQLHERFTNVRAYHLYRDIRTYGKQEILYEKASKQGDVFIRFEETDPPQVISNGSELNIRVKDSLTKRMELEFSPDLIVLVTGMVPRTDSHQLAEILKIPEGTDKFFNEIHPKLRPVETVINGIFIGGSCQGPKNVTESVQSALSAAAKIHATIKRGLIELEPIIARIDPATCTWCDKCKSVCEYDAITAAEYGGKLIAIVNEAVCKGCGICAPVCPADDINLIQFTNNEIEGMIDGFMEKSRFEEGEEVATAVAEAAVSYPMKDLPALWRQISDVLSEAPKTIPEISIQLSVASDIVTYHMMTMNKYGLIEASGIDDKDEFYYYKMK